MSETQGDRRQAFYRLVSEAIADVEAHGFDSQERLDGWLTRLREASRYAFGDPARAERELRASLESVYDRMLNRGGLRRAGVVPGRFTLHSLQPRLRAELDRRIRAAASLIKLNRDAAVEKTLQRFAGWTTSVPAGGSRTVERGETAQDVRKALVQLPFESRRVAIDQGAKLAASIAETVAVGTGAIALIWRSHWRQTGYHFRKDHKERDGQVYLIRGSWAAEQGLVKPGDAGWYDDVTAVAQEPFCRCYATYLTALRRLPEDMLTEKGREALAKVGEGRAAA